MVTIAFEGLPGAGKTTQAHLLTRRLTADGLRVAYLPDLATLTTDPTGHDLLTLFTTTNDPFHRHNDALLDTFLAAALRTHLTATHIHPATHQHDVLIEDRGAHTMYSYSLATLLRHHHMPVEHAITWLRSFTALTGAAADLAIWLRPPVPVAIDRWRHRDNLTPTSEQRAFLAHVDTAYDLLARHDPTIIRIDTDHHEPRELHNLIHAQLSRLLPTLSPA